MRFIQPRRLSLLATLGLCLALVACGPSVRGDGDGGGGGDVDSGGGGTPDAMERLIDADPFGDAGGLCGDNACANPVDDMCGDDEVCGNGLDDDCDGQSDEGCACQSGAVQPCFKGQPGRRNVGSCQDGTQRCEGEGEFATWGDCTGGISPVLEACDTQDNNCNGCEDDSPLCCEVELACPGPGDMPDGTPFANYVINGAQFYAGTVSSWQWTVVGGPCDQLLAPATSYTLTGQTTSTLTFKPTLSGDYTVKVKMTLPDGSIFECEFIVHIGGPGLRFELCWDTDGQADIDLHVHKPDSTQQWFCPGGTQCNINGNSFEYSNDDCMFANCKAASHDAFAVILGFAFPPVEWGLADSPIANCQGGPEGAAWASNLGACANPRLDLDNINTVGKPENINIDNPTNGKTYRAAVHYFSGSVVTHPLVNVYCGGRLKGTYGAAPDTISGFGSGGNPGPFGPLWRVVDVKPTVVGGNVTDCELTPLNPPGQTTGPYVTCPMPGSAADCQELQY